MGAFKQDQKTRPFSYMPESSNIPGRLIRFPNRRTVRLVVGAGKEVNERGPNKMGNQIKI